MNMKTGEYNFCMFHKKLISEMDNCSYKMTNLEYRHFCVFVRKNRSENIKRLKQSFKDRSKRLKKTGLRLKNLDLESYYKDIDASEDE